RERLLVVACDMPFIAAAFVEYLIDLSQDADLVVPMTERGYHPLCAVYRRSCLDVVSRRVAAGQLKVREPTRDVRTRVVRGEEMERFGDCRHLLANVNTPADYAGLLALQGHEL